MCVCDNLDSPESEGCVAPQLKPSGGSSPFLVFGSCVFGVMRVIAR